MEHKNNMDNNLHPLVKTKTMGHVHHGTTFIIVRFAIIFFSLIFILRGLIHWYYWGHL